MGKRVLIISYFFAPQNAMGAVRPTKLAKYLSRLGYEVTVLCGSGMNARQDPTLARDLRELKDVRVIAEWNPLRSRRARRESGAARTGASASATARPSPRGALHAAADAAYRWLRWRSDRSFRRRTTAALRQLEGIYDVVFSTYAPLSVHEIAREAKRRGLARRWIADFRDEVGMAFAWQAGRRARYLRMVRREADVLCAASQGFLEMMGFEDRGRVLSNGYDLEDLPEITETRPRGEKLCVAYCGMLSMGRKGVADRDLTPVFETLKALTEQNLLPADRLRLAYAGAEGGVFRRQAASRGLEGCVEDYGMLSREGSLALQREADVLLMASWHMPSQRGVLTGKLFEYMMMDKPIVCCMAGCLPNSGVKRVLEQTGMGFCCEQAGDEADRKALNAYLTELAERWKQGKRLLMSKKKKEVESYAYPALASLLAAWMED